MVTGAADHSGARAPDLRALMAEAVASFAAATRTRPPADQDVAVAGRRVRLRFAGTRLADALTGAFSYCRLPPGGPPDLTVLAWEAPTEPWAQAALAMVEPGSADRGALSLTDGDVTMLVRGWPTPTLLAIDLQQGLAFKWSAAGAPIAAGDRCRPFLPIFSWWLTRSTWQLVHASAVGGAAGGVLIAGKGGSGKSTTALACARAGWRYAGDDFVLVDDAAAPRVEPLYSSARLRPDMAAHFPELAPLRLDPGTAHDSEKHDFLLARAVAQPAFAGFAVRAILVPRIVDATATAARPASRAEALRALAPSTLGHIKGDARRNFAKIARLAAAVPCFALELGRDLDAIPAVIAAATGAAP